MLVPRSDRRERRWREQAHHLGLLAEVFERRGRPDGYADDDLTGSRGAHRGERRPHRGPGRQPVIDEDRQHIADRGGRPAAAVGLDPPPQLDLLGRAHLLDGGRADAEPPDEVIVEKGRYVPIPTAADRGECSHRELRRAGHTELADDQHVQRRSQRLRDTGGDDDTAARQGEHQRRQRRMAAEMSCQHGAEQLAGFCAIPVRTHVPGVPLGGQFDQTARSAIISRLGPVIQEAVEIERKFDAADTFVFPDPLVLQDALTKALGPVQVRDDGTVQLTATYFDTFDLRLAKDKVTLRRRTGGKDAGWHLKLPGDGDGRREITAPLGRTRVVPTELLDLVQALVRTESLHPVATLKTRRRVLTVLSADDQPLVEVVDDRVSATRQTAQDGTAGEVEIWRELEAEILDGGDARALAAVSEALQRAGATPSAAPSKLARTLGPIGPPLVPEPPETVSPKAPVADVVAAYAAQHVRALQLQDRRLRQDLPDSVHKMRVSARRLRSTLKTFQPILDPEAVAGLETELRWLGMVLGEARDREVLLDRLRDDLADLPDELVLGNVSARLEQTLLPELLNAVDEAKAELRGERYLQLLDALVAFAVQPPVTTNKSAAKVLPDLGHRAWRKVRRRMGALKPDALQAEDAALHSVRKAAKQARYAGEAMVVVYGNAAGKFAAAMESLQELLGEHQDSTVARDLLRRLGAGNRNGFTFGILYGREEARARAARTELPEVWERASAKKLRRWMARS